MKKDWRRDGKGDGQQQCHDNGLNAIAGNEAGGRFRSVISKEAKKPSGMELADRERPRLSLRFHATPIAPSPELFVYGSTFQRCP